MERNSSSQEHTLTTLSGHTFFHKGTQPSRESNDISSHIGRKGRYSMEMGFRFSLSKGVQINKSLESDQWLLLFRALIINQLANKMAAAKHTKHDTVWLLDDDCIWIVWMDSFRSFREMNGIKWNKWRKNKLKKDCLFCRTDWLHFGNLNFLARKVFLYFLLETHLSRNNKEILSLDTLSFLAIVFLRFSTELCGSATTVKLPPVVVCTFKVMGCCSNCLCGAAELIILLLLPLFVAGGAVDDDDGFAAGGGAVCEPHPKLSLSPVAEVLLSMIWRMNEPLLSSLPQLFG